MHNLHVFKGVKEISFYKLLIDFKKLFQFVLITGCLFSFFQFLLNTVFNVYPFVLLQLALYFGLQWKSFLATGISLTIAYSSFMCTIPFRPQTDSKYISTRKWSLLLLFTSNLLFISCFKPSFIIIICYESLSNFSWFVAHFQFCTLFRSPRICYYFFVCTTLTCILNFLWFRLRVFN